MKKEDPLKTRGIRFSDGQWKNILRLAAKDRSGRTTPSHVIRYIVDEYFNK